MAAVKATTARTKGLDTLFSTAHRSRFSTHQHQRGRYSWIHSSAGPSQGKNAYFLISSFLPVSTNSTNSTKRRGAICIYSTLCMTLETSSSPGSILPSCHTLLPLRCSCPVPLNYTSTIYISTMYST